jgi:hypothetical protein
VTTKSEKQQGRRWLRILAWTLGILAIILVLISAGFIFWATNVPSPMPEAIAALESDALVTVEGNNPIVFSPVGSEHACGLIFYAGGRVDERSYAPAMRALAEEGVFVLLPSMPLNLAVFSPNRAAALMRDYPEVERWVVGGHSLGGAMAASFANGNPADSPTGVDGLALWASFPAAGADMSQRTDLAVGSIYGSEDGLATVSDIDASRALLPESTVFTRIEGGNHAQFGWYGPQSGDGEASISREEQQEQVHAATLDLMRTACGEALP